MKKCVITGSGLGGLSCGVILAKNGYDVTVLEKGAQVGGCLQCFHRGNATFDTGMHYIGSAASGQVLNIMMNYLDISSKVELSRLDPQGYDIVSFQGKHYPFANGKEAFVETFAQHFPNCRRELERYYDLMKLVSSSSAMHSLNRHVDLDINTEYQMRSVDQVLDEIFTNPILSQTIAGIQPLYAGVKGHTPFSSHALIHDCFERSAYRIVGGSSIANSLVDVIKDYGGEVLTSQEAVKIECCGTQATAVTTSSGNNYPADLVISTIHPSVTLKLVDVHLVRPLYRKRIESYRNTTSVFVVYLKFRKDSVKYMNHNLYYYRGNTIWGCEDYDDNSWPKFLLYMHFCHEKNPRYASTGKLLTYMSYDEVSKWASSHVGQRGESYEEFKRQKAEALIDALEEEIPGIRKHIESYYTSTPLTYSDYTGTPEGAMYGIARDVKSLGLNSISSKTGIPNVLLAGQNTTFHGMFGVLAGSLITCSEVLSSNEIFKQLGHSL